MYLNEGSRPLIVRRIITDAQAMFVSPLAHVEVRAGLARARFKESPPRLTSANYTRALTLFDQDWSTFFQTDISDEAIRSAGTIAERRRLRAYDAMHLASASTVQQNSADTLLLSTWDRELAAAAEAEGLSLAHEVTN